MRPSQIALLLLVACSGDDGGAVRDAGPVGPDGPIPDAAFGLDCTNVFCDLPETFCCAEQLVPPQVTRFCVNEPQQNICMGIRYFCDGPEDCTGNQVCCTDSGSSDHRCTDLGTCLGQGSVVCHITAHCPAPQGCVDTPLGIIRACQ